MSLEADWTNAATDAGIAPETVLLYPLPSAGDYGAMYFAPGVAPHGWDREFAYTQADRQRLGELVDERVLVVQEDLAPPHRILVLRHEAEHVTQDQLSPQAGAFALRLAMALPQPWLYLAMPHERDADAAATAFRAASGIDASVEILEGRDRFLYNAPWPVAEREWLPIRLLAFSLFFPDDFDLACRANQFWPPVDPGVLTEEMVAGGAAARAQRRRVLDGFLGRLADHGITQEMWDAMTRTERNALSDRLRAAVVERERELVDDLRAVLA